MICLSMLAEPLVKIILTEKWLPSVPYIQIMCLAYMWDPVMRMTYDLLNVKHRSDLSLKSEIIKKIVAFSILLTTIPFGLNIICLGLVLYSLCDIFIITRFTRKLLEQVTLLNILKNVMPSFCISIIMGLVILIFINNISNNYIQVIGGVLIGIIIYILLSYFFNKTFIRTLLSIKIK